MKLTNTNRPFGLIIKLSQSVFEEEADVACNGHSSEFWPGMGWKKLTRQGSVKI
jgi:hypothetical protein